MTAQVFTKIRNRRKATSVSLLLLAICGLFPLNGCERRGDAKPIWIAQLPFHYIDTYNVADGVIVAFGSDREIYPGTETLPGTLIGLDSKTGNKLWETQIEAAGRYLQQGAQRGGSFTVVGAGLVYFRDRSNVLNALDIKTGSPKWRANDVLSLLTIADGQAFIVNGKKQLATLAVGSGAVQKVTELKWQHEIISCTRMEIADGREYLAVDGVVTAKDAASGRQLWSTTFKTEGVEMLATQGFVILTNLSTFAVFEGGTGKPLWHFETDYDVKLPTIERELAYTGLSAKGEYNSGHGFIRGFKLATGEKVVEVKATGLVANGVVYDTERVDHYDPVSKRMVNGYLWRDSSDMRIVAKDARTGAKLWTTDPWCWGWMGEKSATGDVVYAAHVAPLASEPVRLLAYRAAQVAAPGTQP